MKLEFAKLSPTQNMTLLVRTPVSRGLQPRAAEALMRPDSVCAEQVGFLEPASLPGARLRLQMMGGEFCGNASMSLAALLAREDGLPDGAACTVPLEVSGAEARVDCFIERCGADYFGTVSMPLPERVSRTARFGVDCPLIFFPGIAHAIVPADALSAVQAEAQIAGLCAELGADALGLVRYDREKREIHPLVYVRETSSAVWERGCGSGSAALGVQNALEAGRDADFTLPLRQPGGTIEVKTRVLDGRVAALSIRGRVRLVCEGSAYVEL